jgi:uncharacterized DUF497 family protein
VAKARFEWDPKKDEENQSKHGVSFAEAQLAFGEGIMTVRFTYREGAIRIIGAGYWRKGKRIYERENQIHE